jgi:hypothetical protein
MMEKEGAGSPKRYGLPPGQQQRWRHINPGREETIFTQFHFLKLHQVHVEMHKIKSLHISRGVYESSGETSVGSVGSSNVRRTNGDKREDQQQR